MNESEASQDKNPKLLVVVGPTASGKSHLAIELGSRLQGEIISADSVQVYRHFNIGSGKATHEEQARCRHHLLDLKDPDQDFEAAQFAEAALNAITEIQSRGKIPIICGGTFLWVRALVYGLAKAPPADAKTRKKHQEIAQTQGRLALHQQLKEVDPQSAARLHPNDLMRVSRALEVYELTQQSLSSLQAEHGFQRPRFECNYIQVHWERELYEARLRHRIGQMLAAGWKNEVEGLISKGFRESRAMQAIGYKQVLQFLDGEIEEAEVQESIVRVTRIFARRQRTWLRDRLVNDFPAASLNSEEELNQFSHQLQAWLETPKD